MKDFVKFGGVLFHKGLVTFEQARSVEPTLTRAEYNDRISGITKTQEIQVIEIIKKKDHAGNRIEPEIIKPKKRKK